MQKADSLRQAILDGADFAEVARTESADQGSAAQGGELGTFGAGQFPPIFEAAVFSLPVGELSEPIVTPAGIHLIEVESRDSGQVKARHILIPIEATVEALDSLAAKGDSLEQLSTQVGLQKAARGVNATVRTGLTVSTDAPLVSGVGSTIEALDWVEQEVELGDQGQMVSPLFETDQSFYIVQREGYTPAGVAPLEEVSPRIRAKLILDKKRAKAREIGQEMVSEVRGGKSLEEVAQAHGLAVDSAGPMTRIQANPVFGQATAAVGAAFGTPIGEVSDVEETPAGLFIVQPLARTAADRDEFESQKSQLRSAAIYQLQQQQVAQFMQSLRDHADIVDDRSKVLIQSA